MNELHLTAKDFKLEWCSGTGKGGQHRNKHQNCCRITHIESGLQAQGTESRSRITNQKVAFNRLAGRILAHMETPQDRRPDQERVRTYHAVRNQMVDHESGEKRLYTDGDRGFGELVDARRRALLLSECK